MAVRRKPASTGIDIDKNRQEPTPAVGYIRTSSKTNVGFDKDSERRQRKMIDDCAKHLGHEVVEYFTDPGVSGTNAVDTRPGFKRLIEYCRVEKVKVVIFEDASRFTRDLVIQEIAVKTIHDKGLKLISAASPGQFVVEDSPTTKLLRQVLGAVAEFERTNIVTKLWGARKRAGETKNMRTLNNEVQYSGPRSRVHGKDADKIVGALGPFAKKDALQRGDMKRAASACFEVGIANAKGEVCDHRTVKRWLKFVKLEHVDAQHVASLATRV